MIIKGTVKEVRTFLGFVILFIEVSEPEEKFNGNTLKFTLSNDNCQRLLKWAQLQDGDEVTIRRDQNSDIPRNRRYTLESVKSQSIDMEEID